MSGARVDRTACQAGVKAAASAQQADMTTTNQQAQQPTCTSCSVRPPLLPLSYLEKISSNCSGAQQRRADWIEAHDQLIQPDIEDAH